MGTVIRIADHVWASAGQRSGLSSKREIPVSRSIDSTNSAGTPFLDFLSQYQTCDCVVPIRTARGFWPPATSQARFNASGAMDDSYQNLGEKQPKNLSGTGNLIFGKSPVMLEIDKKAFGIRVKQRREKIGLTQGELGKAIGVPQQTVGNWESGVVKRTGHLVELAEALATTPQWLTRKEGPEEVIPHNPEQQIRELLHAVSGNQTGAIIQFLKNLTKKKNVETA